jgi:hypothetical protein
VTSSYASGFRDVQGSSFTVWSRIMQGRVTGLLVMGYASLSYWELVVKKDYNSSVGHLDYADTRYSTGLD